MGPKKSASSLQKANSPDDAKAAFLKMSVKDRAALLKDHPLLRVCSKDKPETLPKEGELVWARVLKTVYWPAFVIELTDLDTSEEVPDDIDDSAYGFVIFLESSFRHAPIQWDQMIRFEDLDTQLWLVPQFNKLVVKKGWDPTTVYKKALEMAVEFSKVSPSERRKTAEAKFKEGKTSKIRTPSPTKPLSSARPDEALKKKITELNEKRKSGIRLSDRITKKQIDNLKPKPESKPATKKTEESNEEKSATKTQKPVNKPKKNPRPEVGGEVLKQWTLDKFNSFSKQYLFDSTNVKCRECNLEILTDESAQTCHGAPYHKKCLLSNGNESSSLKCSMCIEQLCLLCKEPGSKIQPAFKCSRCELRFHIDCLSKDWPQAEIQGSSGPITCPLHFCHTCLGEQKIYGKFRDYTTKPSGSYKCKLCLSTYHKTCLPAGCGEVMEGKEFIICPKHTLPELKVQQRRIGCLGCCKPLKPKEEKVECSLCVQSYHPECIGYTDEIRQDMSLEVFGQGYKCFSCKWGLFPLYGQVVWFQQPQSQYWPARILFPAEHKDRKHVAKRLPGQYSIEYCGNTSYYDNASRGVPLHLTTVEMFRMMKVYQEVPKIVRAHEEAAFCLTFSEEYRDKQLQPPKPVYKKIEKNVYRTVPVQKVKEPTDACACWEEKTELTCQADSGCTNRDMEMECSDRTCKGGKRCCNRMFSERKNDEEFLERKLFPSKGWGVISKKGFQAGDFVAEYRGELIDRNEMKWRLSKKEEEDPMYILEISKEFFIDAEYVGNLSRLINHSCDPNCEVRKYLSQGRSVGGIFAKRDIKVGEEVTFKYGCGSQSTAPFRCRCGARGCTVFVGKDVPENFRVEDDPEPNKERWNDQCSACGWGGNVICCEFPECKQVWHLKCVKLHRPPSKNWCCPGHPAKKVALWIRSKMSRGKSGRGKVANGQSGSNSGPSGIASKSLANSIKHSPTSRQQAKKKISAKSPPVQSVVTPTEVTTLVTNTKVTETSQQQKRRLSTIADPVDVIPQPAQKRRRVSSTITKADASTQNPPEEPAASVVPAHQSRRNLRSSRTLIPAKPSAQEVPSTLKDTKESEMLPNVFETPTTIPSTKTPTEGRRRRANSIPVNGHNRLDPLSSPITRSRRSRRGESMNERSSLSSKLDETVHFLSSGTPASETTDAANQLYYSDNEMPRLGKRSRKDKPAEPFTQLTFNPYVPPRELPPVNLSNALTESDKHIRMGTRSTSGSIIDSSSYNQSPAQNGLSSNQLDTPPVVTVPEGRVEFRNPNHDEDNYNVLQRHLMETKNKNRDSLEDPRNDAQSMVSTVTRATVTLKYKETDHDSELGLLHTYVREQAKKAPMSVKRKTKHFPDESPASENVFSNNNE